MANLELQLHSLCNGLFLNTKNTDAKMLCCLYEEILLLLL